MSNSRVLVNPYPVTNQVSDERWVPPLPDDQKPVDPNSPKCLGCGRYHGSIGIEMNCLRAALLQARQDAKIPDDLRKAGEAMLRIRREVAANLLKWKAYDPNKRFPGSFAQG
jgi:hypothetical protein